MRWTLLSAIWLGVVCLVEVAADCVPVSDANPSDRMLLVLAADDWIVYEVSDVGCWFPLVLGISAVEWGETTGVLLDIELCRVEWPRYEDVWKSVRDAIPVVEVIILAVVPTFVVCDWEPIDVNELKSCVVSTLLTFDTGWLVVNASELNRVVRLVEAAAPLDVNSCDRLLLVVPAERCAVVVDPSLNEGFTIVLITALLVCVSVCDVDNSWIPAPGCPGPPPSEHLRPLETGFGFSAPETMENHEKYCFL